MPRKKKEVAQTVVSVILDQSASMEQVLDATIGGFNEYVQTLQKQDAGNISFSLTLFNTTRIEKRYVNVPVHEVKPLTRETFVPDMMTPLYDAVVDSVEELQEQIKEYKNKPSVVVVMMTDGLENSSKRHTQACVKDLVEKLQAEGNWTFTYIGANQDTWANAAGYGISIGNTMAWDYSDKGTRNTFRELGTSTVMYASSVLRGGGGGAGGMQTKNFFNQKKEEVKK